MYKNQLQELAQRSCFNLPSYACIREGPDHAPRFKATVNFNGEAEHAAAEVALNTLSRRGPSRSLAAKVLDETGVYKNLLQETAHRAGLNLPVYTTVRSGPGHIPVFLCTVDLAGMSFPGEPAKTKKQAQKNAAMAAWLSLESLGRVLCWSMLEYGVVTVWTETDVDYVYSLAHLGSSSSAASSTSGEVESNDEQEQVIIARALASLHGKDVNKSHTQNDRQRGRRKPASARRDTKTSSSNISVYPMPYQSWPYSNFSPDMAMYHMWQQEQASQQQSRMLALPAPLPPADPRILPFIRSIFQPNHSQYFSVREQDPIGVPGIAMPGPGSPLYFPSHSASVPLRSRSQVTIQEIHEEKTQSENDWIRSRPPEADGDPESRKINLQSKSPGFPKIPSVPVSGHSETEIMEPQADKHITGGPGIVTMPSDREPDMGHPVFKQHPCAPGPSATLKQTDGKNVQEIQSEGVRKEPLDWTCGMSSVRSHRETGYITCSTASHIQHQLQNPRALFSSQANQGPHHSNPSYSRAARGLRPSSMAAPVTVRTAVPVCSARPRNEGLNNTSIAPASFMAPAVQVRSVIPVCAAPPTRTVPDTSHQDPIDVSVASSELGKLQI
ncbi:hypothetical protein ACLOJK_018009 [Asimina triloba]